MSLALVHSRARAGIDAPAVRVEVHLSGGLPAIQIVGLPEAAVRESRDRVRAALLCARFEWPQRRITINLAPADLPKDGGRFDLPIALGILAASGQIPLDALAGHEFIGELALTGELRPVDAVIPAVMAAASSGHTLILPQANQAEAALVSQASTLVATTLLQVCAHLQGQQSLPAAEPAVQAGNLPNGPDMRDVRGQAQARRALEVAAAGGHHLLLVGPPGCGKSMLASRLPGLLPALDEQRALETAAIHSLGNTSKTLSAQWRRRPFRAPHHSASAVALVGGGSHPRPGEISLAHNGVLFLDELTQWQRGVLEVLREPLETGSVTIARAARSTTFPAQFQLVAAMNPCPCGWAGDISGRCRCSSERITRYLGHLSGPLLDRIDLQVRIPRLPLELLAKPVAAAEDSACIAQRVANALQRQWQRQGCANAQLDAAGTFAHCVLDGEQQNLLEQAAQRLQLSMRAVQRSLRVARTIADLNDQPSIDRAALAEALSYRQTAPEAAP
ncbi:ATP-dependent protease [Stenotrophomonas koreensis]|uniref:ATP-dependent protease n=1 Tax=Stenotrophomonas koreensis TaxID=266128 RepID=A0A0R0BJT8_9GAMM|nr:YifB family Mg chelatase-like AAA ATPase [Stenotrophomonas koreensis]KRG57597.1 ATP-dependent protease [Stenotrophomonas koreensis]